MFSSFSSFTSSFSAGRRSLTAGCLPAIGISPPQQLVSNSDFSSGSAGWTASGPGFGTYSFSNSDKIAITGGILYFTYISRTLSRNVNLSSYISNANTITAVVNLKHNDRAGGYTEVDTYNFTLLFKNSSGTTVATKTTGTVNAPQNYTDISLTLNRSDICSTFNNIVSVDIQLTGADSGYWNGNHGPMVQYITLTAA